MRSHPTEARVPDEIEREWPSRPQGYVTSNSGSRDRIARRMFQPVRHTPGCRGLAGSPPVSSQSRVITGATSGIGRAAALQFASEGGRSDFADAAKTSDIR
jgi:hypothetical protein